MDAGTIWFEALSNAGQNIAQGISDRRKRMDEISSIDTLLHYGAQSTIPDPNNPQGGGSPIIDPKLLEQWTGYSDREKARAAGGIETLWQYQFGLAREAAGARIKSDYAVRTAREIRGGMSGPGGEGQIVRIGGRTYRRNLKGDLIPMAETTAEKIDIRQSAQDAILADPEADVAYGRIATQQDYIDSKGTVQVGQFTNSYAGAEKGDMARIITKGLK